MHKNNDILYDLNDKPPFIQSTSAAFQHVLASFVGIVTPTLIIGSTLGLTSHIPYLISMALMVSGVATFIQAKRFGRIGCGLIAVQGTSFAFITALITGGALVKSRGGSADDILAMMFGVTLMGAFIEIFISFFIDKIKRVITPLTTGIVITTIGLSLIKVGMTDLAGGFGSESLGSLNNLLLGLTVLTIIICLNASKYAWLRLSSIFIGIFIGALIAYPLGLISFSHLSQLPLISIPLPFKYGLAFDWQIFLPVALVYFLSAVETAGDLTANSLFCGLPIKGQRYLDRIKGGIMADGVNSIIAGVFNTFPNTTFGQNNAVIQLTGVASRYVAFFIAAILIILGVFPMLGGILQAMPKPVLGGATLIMFATIAVAGIKIMSSEPINRRNSLIISTSFGVGLGTMLVPDALSQLPLWLKNILSSPVTTSGFTAILLTLALPKDHLEKASNTSNANKSTNQTNGNKYAN
jgi:xanthine permease XanP